MPPIDPHPEQFAAWWQLYPRKVAKLAALKAWRKVATSEAVIEQIMAGLRAQLPGPSFNPKNRDKSFIPHASTWLNGRRWEDEASGAQKTGAARIIACEKCGDTGIRQLKHGWAYCICSKGQLSGILVPSSTTEAP